MLEVKNIEVIYDEVFLVLRGLSLAVPAGEVVALLGANGAGKSTTLKAISGLLPTEHGEVTDGAVSFDGAPITRLDAAARVKLGISLVMEGRRVFEHLTVHDNLVAGGYSRRSSAEDFERVYTFLPRLAELRGRVAGYLSGGEQQMLAIGRALMTNPSLLLLDEPTEGLAPLLVLEVGRVIGEIKRQGLSILLVEQNLALALSVADRTHILSRGQIVYSARPDELQANEEIKSRYLGVT